MHFPKDNFHLNLQSSYKAPRIPDEGYNGAYKHMYCQPQCVGLFSHSFPSPRSLSIHFSFLFFKFSFAPVPFLFLVLSPITTHFLLYLIFFSKNICSYFYIRLFHPHFSDLFYLWRGIRAAVTVQLVCFYLSKILNNILLNYV